MRQRGRGPVLRAWGRWRQHPWQFGEFPRRPRWRFHARRPGPGGNRSELATFRPTTFWKCGVQSPGKGFEAIYSGALGAKYFIKHAQRLDGDGHRHRRWHHQQRPVAGADLPGALPFGTMTVVLFTGLKACRLPRWSPWPMSSAALESPSGFLVRQRSAVCRTW